LVVSDDTPMTLFTLEGMAWAASTDGYLPAGAGHGAPFG
jgi:hypothetical protein